MRTIFLAMACIAALVVLFIIDYKMAKHTFRKPKETIAKEKNN